MGFMPALPTRSPVVNFDDNAAGLPAQTCQPSRDDLQRQRQSLPIFKHRKRLIDAVRANANLVVVGETGSGKTTQLPQYLLETTGLVPNGQKVVVTQPRRVAAVTVAQRVAMEMGTAVGQTVGYHIRFEDRTSASTRLKFATDGMLLRECITDPDLSRYAVVILDEAHERTVHTDALLALVRRAQRNRRQKGRRDLKVICMSATIQSERFAEYLDQCPIEIIKGRTFPVDIFYLRQPERDYVDAALIAILQIHLDRPLDGDILCFLTGQEEIESVQGQLEDRVRLLSSEHAPLLIRPIYAALPQAAQMRVFERTPDGARKVVLATNIAETSITIDGIRYVVDCGLAKKRTFQSVTGVDSLVPSAIARSEAWQRSGRAGRQMPGQCYRLYTEETFDTLDEVAVPEIQRCNLASVVLQLKSLGIDDILGFEFMDPPKKQSLIQALMHLYELEALDAQGRITALGRRMSHLALEPVFARVLLASVDMGCFDPIVTIIAMLSTDPVFHYSNSVREEADAARRRFAGGGGDHVMLLNVYDACRQVNFDERWCTQNFVSARALRKARSIRAQLQQAFAKVPTETSLPGENPEALGERIRRCLITGMFLNVAILQPDGSYRTHTKQVVSLHPTSSLFPKRPKPTCVLFTELIRTTKVYMRTVSEIDHAWVHECTPRVRLVNPHDGARQ
ncbi:unnamed protein product (mitochondrion) [Plasmodiophora brassicae]|uniref:RNA helicase n=1 Tax=Plasmodiophora brassicae TaxID=37360 RepID=A0A0G4IKD6_PLABS|nr:hypothetical protein PBRA_004271 [Plasmodiophora brassicae]SPR00419.1 unnamed protein product [Plasmodiophora brassicae]